MFPHYQITIASPLTHVPLSLSRRPKYYRRGDKIPKRFTKPRYDKQGFLLDSKSQRVQKNKRSAGTPRLWRVNGQDLYSGRLQGFARKRVVAYLHQYLAGHIGSVITEPLPLAYRWGVALDIHGAYSDRSWDVDNQWIWIKCFCDTLVEQQLLPDDNIQYINEAGRIRHIPAPKYRFTFHVYATDYSHER